MRRRHFVRAVPAALLAPGASRAQVTYPARPIRYIVPVAAGGGSDMVGGGGVIACQAAARAPADGYTLLQGYVATHGTSPATRKLPYDPGSRLHAGGHDRGDARSSPSRPSSRS